MMDNILSNDENATSLFQAGPQFDLNIRPQRSHELNQEMFIQDNAMKLFDPMMDEGPTPDGNAHARTSSEYVNTDEDDDQEDSSSPQKKPGNSNKKNKMHP